LLIVLPCAARSAPRFGAATYVRWRTDIAAATV
jgi:hypothetical protein